MTGKPDSPFANRKFLVEFKYAPIREEATCRWLELAEPLPADVRQVTGYADDIRREFLQFTVWRYVIYIVGRKGFRVFALDRPAEE